MTIISSSVAALLRPNTASPNTASPNTGEERLRKTATQLEGLFVQRLFAAMRDTVPEGGLMDRSNAEETFTSLLDEKVSEQVPSQFHGEHSLAAALYNQLRLHLGAAEAASNSEMEAASTALLQPHA